VEGRFTSRADHGLAATMRKDEGVVFAAGHLHHPDGGVPPSLQMTKRHLQQSTITIQPGDEYHKPPGREVEQGYRFATLPNTTTPKEFDSTLEIDTGRTPIHAAG
jgi:hypothetical protein